MIIILQTAGGRARINLVLSADVHKLHGFPRLSRVSRDSTATLFFLYLVLFRYTLYMELYLKENEDIGNRDEESDHSDLNTFFN